MNIRGLDLILYAKWRQGRINATAFYRGCKIRKSLTQARKEGYP